MKSSLIILFAAALSISAQIVQNPSVRGLTLQSSGPMYAQPVVGYDFTPTKPIDVDYLGVFDDAGDGLFGPHTVGLFIRQTGKLLTSTTINNNNFLEGVFRWRQVTRITLVPGVVYNIAAYNPAFDPVYANYTNTIKLRSDITFNAGYLEALNTGLHMPTREGGPGAIFVGPVFGTAVPEASTLALFFGGLSMLGIWSIRTRTRKVRQ